MENQAVFLQCIQEVTISKTTTPEFYRFYLQAILLFLKEQGFLNDIQTQDSLDILHHQVVWGDKK